MDKKIEKFLNLSLDQVMSDRFGRYSKYIIQDRALPDARDGLKPVQRRILFSMNDLGLLHSKAFKKSARVVGEVIGKYHPHGDSSIYEAMVRMSQDWKMNMPLIEMHGNNGSIDDDPAAAMRYTEARLSKIGGTLLDNIKKDTVLFAPNFDDSEKEPTVLPALFPNLLVNGTKGIAAGYATEMPPHNLGEVIEAIIAKIKSPNIRLETLMTHIKGPDFPTGGIVQGKKGIYDAFETGRGRVVIRSKYEINESKTSPSINIYEIPYGVNKSKLVKDIDEIRFNNKISGIKEVRDETDRKGISIVIELDLGTKIEPIVNYLLSKTDLQIYYNYNSVAIKEKAPTQMSLQDLIESYLKHQREIQRRALNFILEKDKKRLEIIEGFIRVGQMPDKVIEVIKNAEGSKSGVVSDLQSIFSFTEIQSVAIAELRLYRLSRTDQSIYIEEGNELKEKISKIERILSTEKELDGYLVYLLRILKKEFALPRKSIIEDEVENISINMEALIKHEDAWVGISRDGYIKRFSNRAYESNKNEEYELKEGDSLVYLDKINTAYKLLVFTSKGNYYFIPAHKIEEVKFKEVGKNLNDFATKGIDEKIVDVIAVEDFNIESYVTLVSAEGKAKRVAIKDFEVSRFSKTYKAIKISESDYLVGARLSNGYRNLLIVNNHGKSVFYSENQVPIQSTKSSGIKGIVLSNDSFVSAFSIISKGDVVGIVSKRGGGKRIKESEIKPMSKTTQGTHLFKEIKGNPHIITDVRPVKPDDIAIFTTDKINEKRFGDINISTIEEGLSQMGPSMVRLSRILKFDLVSLDNELLKVMDNISDEIQFDEAEEKINSIDQIDIDELLKGL